jgi:hypothetical protein
MTPLPKSLGPRFLPLRPRPITPGFHPLRRTRCQRYKSDSAQSKNTNTNINANTNAVNEELGSNTTHKTTQSQSHLHTHASPPQQSNTLAASAGAATPPSTHSLTRSRGFRELIKAGPIGKVGRWYARVQNERPYTTQFWSSIVIYLCGDLSAQMLFPAEVLPEKGDAQAQPQAQAEHGDGDGNDGPRTVGYDPYRTMRHLVVGAGSSIPSYNW